MHIAIPPAEEQARIVARVDELLSVGTVLERTVAMQLKRSGRARQAILKWAFEGKLVDQDPTDEPASHLLDRISAERAARTPRRRPLAGRAKGAA